MYDFKVRRVMQTIAAGYARRRNVGNFDSNEKVILEMLLLNSDARLDVTSKWVSLTSPGQEKLYKLNGMEL